MRSLDDALGAGSVGRAVEVEVAPAGAYRLPRIGSEDGVLRVEGGVATRLLVVEGSPVLVRAWEPGAGRVALRADPVDPAALECRSEPAEPADAARLGVAIARMRFALGVDEDLGDFFRAFRRDPLLGPILRRGAYRRPLRRPWPWEALAWAVVKQLIESDRAARIQRRIVGRWGPRLGSGRGALRDVPDAGKIAGRAPAELAALDLSPARAIALRAVARSVATGRCDPADPADDRRLLAIPEIGPWTVQCLGLYGRGQADSLPAGDLMYIKLVTRLTGLRRRATVPEVEEFFAPYAPFRALAGVWLSGAFR